MVSTIFDTPDVGLWQGRGGRGMGLDTKFALLGQLVARSTEKHKLTQFNTENDLTSLPMKLSY